MHALITGGAGFIGSHLGEALLSAGWQVSILDNLSTGTFANIEHLLGNSSFHFANAGISDAIGLDRLASQADVVFHLAAAVGVQLIVQDPVHTVETNVMGTAAVLKAALRYRCKLLLASTSEVYGKGAKVPFAEDDDVVLGSTSRCRWAYAASKMVDEFLGLAYHKQFSLPVIAVRFFNTVGPRQTGQYGMVLPRFVGQALAHEPISVYGDGHQSRCFCYVGDVVNALKQLIVHPDAPGNVYNIGSREEISIGELAERVKRLLGSRSEIHYVPYSEAYAPGFEDMYRRVPDTRRIERLLDWRPTTSLDSVIRKVADHMTAGQATSLGVAA